MKPVQRYDPTHACIASASHSWRLVVTPRQCADAGSLPGPDFADCRFVPVRVDSSIVPGRVDSSIVPGRVDSSIVPGRHHPERLPEGHRCADAHAEVPA